jgi:tRNA(Ile)-lysidine synthase
MTRPSSKIPLSPREKITGFLGRLGMGSEDRMVVAFSGGPDSTFLLRALIDLLGPDRLVAAHFDHELRGDESRGDARFCEAFAQAERVPFQIERADVAKYAKVQKLGTEEAARELRYGFLERIRQETGARFIVTGHTADDLAETVLLRFAKGTKIRGLKGIPEISGAIVRPMLSVSKAEILSELRASNTAFRTDSSNADVSYERNRVRIRILPELADINPEVRSTLTDFSEYATELDRFLEAAVSGFL